MRKETGIQLGSESTFSGSNLSSSSTVIPRASANVIADLSEGRLRPEKIRLTPPIVIPVLRASSDRLILLGSKITSNQ